MTKALKAVICVGLSCICLFLAVGYAALTDMLTINGDVSYEYVLPPIYIKSAKVVSGSITDESGEPYFRGTMIKSTPDFSQSKEVIIEISVVNQTSALYGYQMATALPDVSGNSLVTYQLYTDSDCSMSARGAELPSCQNADGTVNEDMATTYYLKILPKNETTTTAETYLNLHFITPITDIYTGTDVGALAANATMEQFAKILNDPNKFAALNTQLEEGADANERTGWFLTIINALIEIFGGTALSKDGFIAYVPDTIAMMDELGDASDAKVCKDLFGLGADEELTMTIDGVEYPVYFAIVCQNIVGDENPEYILYMTTDTLEENHGGQDAIVYAGAFTSFTYTDTSEQVWYQLGEMYTGVSKVSTYTQGELFSNDNYGSFEFYGWEASQAYYGVTEKITMENILKADAQSTSSCMTSFIEQFAIAAKIIHYDKNDAALQGAIYTEESVADLTALIDLIDSTMGGNGEYLNSIKSSSTQEEIEEAIKTYFNALVNSSDNTTTQAQIVSFTREINKYLVALERI